LRPSDIRTGFGNPDKAAQVLGWRAQYRLEDIIQAMVTAQQGKLSA